jgi:hypothetical protein
MTTDVFATKDPAEIQNLAFDFSPDLGSETLTGASQTSGIEVLAGTDASPSNVLNGAPILSGTLVVALQSKHGHALENLWQNWFGYGLGYLTESEARHLLRAEDVDTIRNRIVAARP